MLARFETKVKTVLAAGADTDDFAPEEVAGIAGTMVEACIQLSHGLLAGEALSR